MAETSSDSVLDTSFHTDLPVGEILRRTREHYQQSLEDIERALRIRASQIKAIEDGNLKALPGRVYAIGFVRTYSEYLGLDGDKMVKLFKRQMGGHTSNAELQFPVPADEGHAPPWWVMGLCALAVIVLLSFWFGERKDAREIVDTVPPVSSVIKNPAPQQEAADETAATTEEGADVPEGPPAPAEETIAEKPVTGIVLNIRENSWVEIRDNNGKAMLSRVLQAGDQYYVPDRPDLNISIGNAGGVEVEVDGKKLRPLGEPGKVLRRLPLDAAYLKKNFALEQTP